MRSLPQIEFLHITKSVKNIFYPGKKKCKHSSVNWKKTIQAIWTGGKYYAAWEMIAVDILEVPLSSHKNRYLLVVQDYFTKWETAIALPDQTAICVLSILVKIFSEFGVPKSLHSDQGRIFESTILCQTLEVFGICNAHTTSYHAQCDGMVELFNHSLLQMLQPYVDTQDY